MHFIQQPRMNMAAVSSSGVYHSLTTTPVIPSRSTTTPLEKSEHRCPCQAHSNGIRLFNRRENILFALELEHGRRRRRAREEEGDCVCQAEAKENIINIPPDALPSSLDVDASLAMSLERAEKCS